MTQLVWESNRGLGEGVNGAIGQVFASLCCMATRTLPTPFFYRLMGAATLDTGVYEEVEGDQNATVQAFCIVLLSSLAAGIGIGGLSAASIGYIAAVALITWAAWALLIFEIGTRLMQRPRTRADVGQLLRTIGFATTPGLLLAFGALPGSTIPVFAVSGVWMMAAMVVGIRQALDFDSTMRAIAVCVVAWLLAMVFAIGLGLAFGPTLS